MRLLALAAVAVLGACEGSEQRFGEAGAIDEREGSYRGVGIGATEAEVRRVVGEPGGGEGFSPLGETFGEIGGAPAVRNWPLDWRGRPTVLRYDGVAFLVGPEGVFALVVTDAGARTRRGIAVGDPLARARRRYRLGCGEQVYAEPLFGGDAPTFRWCRGTIGGRIRIWFGRDPIQSVTLARVAR